MKLWWRWRESNPKSSDAQSQLDTGTPTFTQEQWTQIWTQISGEDRRML